jgi:hypothetical protein
MRVCWVWQTFGAVAPQNEKAKLFVENELKGDEELTPEIAANVGALWADDGIQVTYGSRTHFQLTDSVRHTCTCRFVSLALSSDVDSSALCV